MCTTACAGQRRSDGTAAHRRPRRRQRRPCEAGGARGRRGVGVDSRRSRRTARREQRRVDTRTPQARHGVGQVCKRDGRGAGAQIQQQGQQNAHAHGQARDIVGGPFNNPARRRNTTLVAQSCARHQSIDRRLCVRVCARRLPPSPCRSCADYINTVLSKCHVLAKVFWVAGVDTRTCLTVRTLRAQLITGGFYYTHARVGHVRR